MLGASINYPARGAVTWKSIVGTNVASDALTYLSSAGVQGGALIVVGEEIHLEAYDPAWAMPVDGTARVSITVDGEVYRGNATPTDPTH